MSDVRETTRWRGVLAVSLVAGGAGLLAKRPTLLLVSALGVVYAAYPWVTATPNPELELDRRVADRNPQPGDRVTVTTVVENVGDDTLWDLRVVDGVPPALSVVEGAARLGTALRPGDADEMTYAVEAKRGRHSFEDATAVARDVSGGHEVETTVGDDTEVDCAGDLTDVPLRAQTGETAGRLAAGEGGAGIEFHQTRSYRRGDPVRRIDWNRYAETGELSTIEFQEEQSVTTILLVDAREPSYRGRSGEPHAVAHAVSAAAQLFDALLDDRHRVGIGAFGREFAWLPPGAGRTHRLRGRRLLAEHAAFDARPPDAENCPALDEQLRTLQSRAPELAQVLALSPVLDPAIVDALRSLEARGRPVSVVSPDVTDGAGRATEQGDERAAQRGDVPRETMGATLAGLERRTGIRALRRGGVHVVDWDPDRPLSAALADVREVGRQ